MSREWVLNSATNRWGLNKRSSVGPVTAWIRECGPRTIEEWQDCYFQRLSEFLSQRGHALGPEEYLESLGDRLYIKISEVLAAEIEEVTLEDCRRYVRELVLQKTFEGYVREKETVYGQLQQMLGVNIVPAPEDLDRKYNVDFVVDLPKGKVGIQIKPVTFEQARDIQRWVKDMEGAHARFQQRFRGRVHIVLSRKVGRGRIIHNPEVVEEIKGDISRLS